MLMEETLTLTRPECPGIEKMTESESTLVGDLGGHALVDLDDPADWLDKTWAKLRPIRELNWRRDGSRLGRNSIGAILCLWGFSAFDLTTEVEHRKKIWVSLEKQVRDASQTDAFGHSPEWTNALIRLFRCLPIDEDGSTADRRMTQALLPYTNADSRFIQLVLALTSHNHSLIEFQKKVKSSGFDLAILIDQFLEMKDWVFSLPQTNKQFVEKLRRLSTTLKSNDNLGEAAQ
jgi:hypothetical protein